VTSTKNTKRKSVSSVKLRWQWPTKGKVIQSFSSKDPNRKGIKLAGYAGEAVYASEAGKVVYSGSGLIGYGMLIIVKHNNDYLSAYGHNRKLLVKEGDQVKRGMRIAEMGKNGSGQAMLHFEIRRNGNPINPVALLPRRR
jgi:lipoprotein NlpD